MLFPCGTQAVTFQKAKADLEKVEAELGRAKIEISQTSRDEQEMLKCLDDIENRMKKLEEDAITMAKKQE